jgi:hypothetical protein
MNSSRRRHGGKRGKGLAARARERLVTAVGGIPRPLTVARLEVDVRGRLRGPGVRAAEPRPHLLVALSEEPRDQLLGSLGDVVVATVVDRDWKLLSNRAPVDVAVVAPERLGCTASLLFMKRLVGIPEMVFVIDDVWSPQRFVLEGRGCRYVVTAADLGWWLVASLDRLCAIARTRRHAAEALARRPDPPRLPPARDRAGGPTLHAAETNFRQTYLRLLLAEHGSRRKAAVAAGVPYRSFCDMVRRAGI